MADFLITGGDLDSDVSEDRGENLSQENREDISEENNGGPSEDHSVNDLEELDACWMLRFIESYIIDEESNVSESCSEDMEDSEDLHTTSNDNSEEHDGSRDNPDHNIDETDHGLFQTITEQRMWRTLLGFFSFSNNRDSEQEQSDSSGDEITDGCHLIECWMPRFDLDQTIKLKISHGRSISIVDLLRKREITGTVEYQDNAAERGTLLALVLQNRWSSVKLGEIFIDARKMLNRHLSTLEFCILEFLHSHAIKQLERSETKNNGLKQLAINTLVPITFMDIILTLQKIGVNLLCRDKNGSDLMMEIVRKIDLTDENVDFIEFLIKSGLDVHENGEKAIEALCTNTDYTISSPVRYLRFIKMILDAGLALSAQGKQDLLRKFTNSFLWFAEDTTVEIVDILTARGCQAKEALIAIEPVDCDLDLCGNKWNIDCILRIAMTLLQNGARVNSNGKFETPCFIFSILDLARELPDHPSMLPLLNKCIERGLDMSVTNDDGENLLNAFCEKYKREDLPNAIRLLITSGVDVNHVDLAGMNSIVSLSRNNPVGREAVFNAVSTLLEVGIDAKRVESFGSSVLLHFLSSSPMAECCKYKNLELCNGSSYWKTLDLLLDASPDVVRSVDYVGVNLLQAHLTNWALHPLWEDNICNTCLTTDFPAMLIDDAIASLGISNFKNVLRFLERLIEAGARVDSKFLNEEDTPLHFVFRSYSGDRLIALVELLCKSGANVNARIPSKSKGRKSKMNVLELIRQENPTQVNLILRLIEVMMPYGFKFDP